MAQLKAEIKRGFLRSLYRQVSKSATPLSDALDSFQDQGFCALKSGRLVLSSQGNGHATTFQVPTSWQNFTEEEVFSLSEELQQVFDDAMVTVASAGGDNTDDAQLFDAMMADYRLQTVTESYTDHTVSRWPNRFQ